MRVEIPLPGIENAEAHLGIDLQQQIRQLRFADPVIERGAQLDQLRLLFFGRQGCQVQLVIDPQFTGLDSVSIDFLKLHRHWMPRKQQCGWRQCRRRGTLRYHGQNLQSCGNVKR